MEPKGKNDVHNKLGNSSKLLPNVKFFLAVSSFRAANASSGPLIANTFELADFSFDVSLNVYSLLTRES